jgi:hypothetical protein
MLIAAVGASDRARAVARAARPAVVAEEAAEALRSPTRARSFKRLFGICVCDIVSGSATKRSTVRLDYAGERLNRTLKRERLRRWLLPFDKPRCCASSSYRSVGNNELRPHASHFGASRQRGSRGDCRLAVTRASRRESAGEAARFSARGPGVRLLLDVSHLEGRVRLPIVSLRPAIRYSRVIAARPRAAWRTCIRTLSLRLVSPFGLPLQPG